MIRRPTLNRFPKWTKVTTRRPNPRNGSPGYIVTNGHGVWVETIHPSWWNTKDRRGKEWNGPTVTHWMKKPEPPRA